MVLFGFGGGFLFAIPLKVCYTEKYKFSTFIASLRQKENAMAFNKYIRNAGDLVTSHEQTRAGFLKIALDRKSVV